MLKFCVLIVWSNDIGNNSITGNFPEGLADISGLKFIGLGKQIWWWWVKWYDVILTIWQLWMRYSLWCDLYVICRFDKLTLICAHVYVFVSMWTIKGNLNMTGSIPKDLGSIPSLEYLDIGRCIL